MEQYVCQLSDLVEQKPYVVKIEDLEIGVVLVKGEVLAFENYCPHAGGPVCLGDVFGAIKVELKEDKSYVREYISEDDFRLVCPWHGFVFNVHTRECVTDSRFKIRGFTTTTRNDQVFVHIPGK